MHLTDRGKKKVACLHCSHVMKAICKFDKNHTRVVNHAQQHSSQFIGLKHHQKIAI